MSVITFPRREVSRPVPRATPVVRQHARHGVSVSWWTHRSLATRLAIVILCGVGLVLAGSSYAAQRQVQIQQMQNTLLQDQAKYASAVASLTNSAAPGRVAVLAGHFHLVEPSSVTQISTVPLTVVLARPTLSGSDVVTTRVFR